MAAIEIGSQGLAPAFGGEDMGKRAVAPRRKEKSQTLCYGTTDEGLGAHFAALCLLPLLAF